jgi:stress response protein YsnF
MAKAANGRAEETILVAEERPVIRKRKKITGAVQIRTRVREDEHLVERPVTSEEVAVERVPVDRWVDAPVEVRQEGDVTVIPVHAEVVVVETRLKLVEEIHVRRRRSTAQARERVVLRSEEAVVDRLAAAEDEPPG